MVHSPWFLRDQNWYSSNQVNVFFALVISTWISSETPMILNWNENGSYNRKEAKIIYSLPLTPITLNLTWRRHNLALHILLQ